MLNMCNKLLCGYVVLAFFSGYAAAESQDLASEGFTDEKHKTCISCHQSDPVKQMFLTKHANADNPDTPASKEQCESCHGPSAAHANFPLQIKNFRFGVNSANSNEEQNKACLTCHADERREEWHGGMHEKGELSCASCHTIHKVNDPLLDHTQSALICIDCHNDKKATQHIKGLHIIETGKVACTDCHNPHAKLDGNLCVTCHKQDADTLGKQSQKAQGFHETMNKNELSCLKCHSGVAHGVPSWVEDIKKQQQNTDR